MTKPYCWTVNAKGEVWTLDTEGRGTLMSPAGEYFALSIAVNWVGDAWIISSKPRPGGAVLMVQPYSEPGDWHALAAPAAATKVSTGSGTLWTVNGSGEVWALEPTGGGYLASPPGENFALDICAGLDGSVWVISTESSEAGNVMKSYDQGTKVWTSLPTPANTTNMAVGKGGELYTVNVIGEVWLRYPQGGHVHISPEGVDFADEISIGADGTVWITGVEPREGGQVVMWWSGMNEIWNTVPAPAAAVKIAGAVQS